MVVNPPKPLDELRGQLQSLGYLTRRFERWFALDPWSSRAFWAELLAVTLKAGTLVAPFSALPLLAAMLLRNRPLPLWEGVVLGTLYLAASFVAVVVLTLLSALLLKIRPTAAIEHPVILTGAGVALTGALATGFALWWLSFPDPPATLEWLVEGALVVLLFVVGTTVFSAALLSFTIHEARRIPAVARGSRTAPVLVAAAAALAVIWGVSRQAAIRPPLEVPGQIVVTPGDARVALVAVDGLAGELFSVRPSLAAVLPHRRPMTVPPYLSAAERWASIGTGTPRELHEVRSIEAIRLAGGTRPLQSVSRVDPLRSGAASRLGLVRRQPLPTVARARAYVWEILGSRGVPVLAVNWWVTPDAEAGGLRSVSQERIFAGSRGAGEGAAQAAAVDQAAVAALESALASEPRFVTVYLPSLDVILHRIELAESTRLAATVAALDRVEALVRDLRVRGYDVILAGAPGEEGEAGILASTIPLQGRAATAAWDLAPTLLDLFGFPRSSEMEGASLLPASSQTSIASYGSRTEERSAATKVDREYYEALRSLGYVQ